MGKLVPKKTVDKKHNLESLLKKENDICFEICRVTSCDLNLEKKEREVKKATIKNKVKQYAEMSKNKDKNSQSGRVWFLVENKECSEVLQVAQALDYNWSEKKYFVKGYFNEIISHIDEMFKEEGGKYKEFANNIRESGSLVFYELAIDRYLEEFGPEKYKDTIYEIARDYYAEASLAHFTQAKKWGYYGPGMDKRAYYNILENLEGCDQIDKQKKYK